MPEPKPAREITLDFALQCAPILRRHLENELDAEKCWEWKGTRTADGYGRLQNNYRRYRATRISWMIANRIQLPTNRHVLHRCDNPPCVNPAHLFLGTQSDNMQDAKAKGRIDFYQLGLIAAAARNRPRTHCKRGHAFTPDNCLTDGKQKCRTCHCMRLRAYRARRTAAKLRALLGVK